jgi:hypothetical protein
MFFIAISFERISGMPSNGLQNSFYRVRIAFLNSQDRLRKFLGSSLININKRSDFKALSPRAIHPVDVCQFRKRADRLDAVLGKTRRGYPPRKEKARHAAPPKLSTNQSIF